MCVAHSSPKMFTLPDPGSVSFKYFRNVSFGFGRVSGHRPAGGRLRRPRYRLQGTSSPLGPFLSSPVQVQLMFKAHGLKKRKSLLAAIVTVFKKVGDLSVPAHLRDLEYQMREGYPLCSGPGAALRLEVAVGTRCSLPGRIASTQKVPHPAHNLFGGSDRARLMRRL